MTTTTTRRPSDLDQLSLYREAIRRHPPLGREEERALALRVREGDVEARKKLAAHNLAFVVSVARRQRRGGVRLDDLVQEGNLGLLRAIEKFDPDQGTRFSTYAVWWIRAYVGKHLKEARSTVRPLSGTTALSDLSLDATVDEEGEITHLDRIEDEGPGPEARYLSAEEGARVRARVKRVRRHLGEIGWDVIHSRLEQDDPVTLEELGKRWGVSRERVRQVELRAKHVLRRALAPEELEAA